MKVLNKISGEKTRPLDLALLGLTVAGYGIAMALAAGLALMGKEKAAPEAIGSDAGAEVEKEAEESK